VELEPWVTSFGAGRFAVYLSKPPFVPQILFRTRKGRDESGRSSLKELLSSHLTGDVRGLSLKLK
jgi:hypothetical protein